MAGRRLIVTASIGRSWHAHAEANLAFVAAGSLTENTGRADETARPGELVVKPPAAEHRDDPRDLRESHQGMPGRKA